MNLNNKFLDAAISNGIIINLFKLMASKDNNWNHVDPKLSNIKKKLNKKLKKNDFKIGVFVASYNEEKLIETCLKSIRETIDHSAWRDHTKIILLDSHSIDQTTQIASKYVDKIIDCPRGKLNARHHGYMNEDCDIIVCADSDRQYQMTWFESLVEPIIKRKEVIATVGHSNDDYDMYKLFVEKYKLPFNGGNSAFIRDCYLQSPFNLTVNQFDINYIWFEEEFTFGMNLSKMGKIVYAKNARFIDLREDNVVRSVMRFFGVPIRTF